MYTAGFGANCNTLLCLLYKGDIIEDTANDWLDRMMPDMARAVGVTEELKACDQMAWVGLMNNCKAQVEEIIFAELVYC